MRISEEGIHTFKENDMVRVVAGSSNYKGRHSGRTGTVKYVYEQKRANSNIAVALDGINNEASSKGWFYFKESDLRGNYSFFSHREREIADLQSMSSCAHVLSVLNDLDFEKFAYEGENKNMKSEKILELWKKSGMENIGAEMAREEETLIAADGTCAQLREHVAEIDRIIAESGHEEERASCMSICDQFASQVTKQKIANARNKMTDKKKDLNRLVEEIAAMLSVCDTYEQEMNVLRTYDVIDENGRLNKFFVLKT